jgi:threonine dehydrogenase-like Zn-dependent dehydrogenase
MWGGHCGHAVVKASDLALLPNNADPAAASAARLVAIAYHGVRLSKPSAHDTVLVFGLGPIGMLSAWLHALSGARVVGMDFSEDRCTRARTGGVETIHIAPGDPEPFWREVLPQGADVVVDTTGVPSVLTAAVRAAREVPWHAEDKPRPRILIQGSYPKDGLPTLPYYDVFAREASLLVPRDCESRDITSALTFIARKALPIERLHNAVHPVSEAPSAYRSLTSPLTAPPLAIFRW